MPPRDWDAGEHTCTSKRQTLPHHARLLSFHLMEQWKFKMNQETNLQTEETESFTLFFSPEETPHWGFHSGLQIIRKGMIQTTQGRFPCPHRHDENGFLKRQLLCLRSLSCSSRGPLQVASGFLLVGMTKWTYFPPQQPDTYYLNFDTEKADAYQTSELQEFYWSWKQTFYEKVCASALNIW